MEGRDGHPGRQPGREFQIAQAGEGLGDQRPQLVDHRGQVGRPVEEPGHLLRAQAFQVVTGRELEDVVAGVAQDLAQRLPPPQDLEHHQRGRVLLERIVEGQLLAPLDVGAEGLDVDAGAADLEIVEHLHGLQFEEAGAGQPGQHDVLRHLGVGAGGRSERRRDAGAAEIQRNIGTVLAAVELAGGQIEDAAARPPFVRDAGQQHVQGPGSQRRNGVGHHGYSYKVERDGKRSASSAKDAIR